MRRVFQTDILQMRIKEPRGYKISGDEDLLNILFIVNFKINDKYITVKMS